MLCLKSHSRAQRATAVLLPDLICVGALIVLRRGLKQATSLLQSIALQLEHTR